jgi:hypothetical protein
VQPVACGNLETLEGWAVGVMFVFCAGVAGEPQILAEQVFFDFALAGRVPDRLVPLDLGACRAVQTRLEIGLKLWILELSHSFF